MPVAGGYLDQPLLLMDVFKMIGAEYAAQAQLEAANRRLQQVHDAANQPKNNP